MKHLILISILFLVSACGNGGSSHVPSAPSQCRVSDYDIWHEDNNMGRANEIPSDFISKFSDPKWLSTSRNYVDVYMIRKNTIRRDDIGLSFVTNTLIPYLSQTNTELAFNATGATWGRYNNVRIRNFEEEMKLLRALKAAGTPIHYISLQSVLSKDTPDGGNYPMNKRLEDISNYIDEASKIYPDASIGLIDAMPSRNMGNWRTVYSELDRRLDYIHLDVSYERIRNFLGWRGVQSVETTVENLGFKFGLFVTSGQGGRTSNQEFLRRATLVFDGYINHCGTPDEYILASWFPFPDNTVPTMTQVLNHMGNK